MARALCSACAAEVRGLELDVAAAPVAAQRPGGNVATFKSIGKVSKSTSTGMPPVLYSFEVSCAHLANLPFPARARRAV
jgi:hypothetical protein